WYTADGRHEALDRLRAIACGAKVDPWPRRKARRQRARPQRVGCTGQEDRDQALAIGEVGSPRRQPERSQIVRANLGRAQEHHAQGLLALILFGWTCIRVRYLGVHPWDQASAPHPSRYTVDHRPIVRRTAQYDFDRLAGAGSVLRHMLARRIALGSRPIGEL